MEAIGAGNLGTVAREIDWIIKYQLPEQYRGAPQGPRADLTERAATRPRQRGHAGPHHGDLGLAALGLRWGPRGPRLTRTARAAAGGRDFPLAR